MSEESEHPIIGRNDHQFEMENFRQENEVLRRQLRWFKAAHWLLANQEAFIFPEDGSPFFIEPTMDPNKGCSLALNMSDTFEYACADAEPFTYEQAEELVTIAKNEGWPGLVRWVAKQRGYDPLPAVQKKMEEYDATNNANPESENSK